MQQHGYSATGKAGFCRVGAAGEDDGNACAKDNAGKLRAAKVFKLLGEHVSAFEVGNNKDVSLAGDGRNEILDSGCLDADGSIEGKRAIEDAAGDLTAVGHLAQCGRVERGLDLRIDRFDG